MDAIYGGIDFAFREATLFAACGFLLLGVSDLAVDLVWIVRTSWRRSTVYRRFERGCAGTLKEPERAGRLAVFVPAWDEGDVVRDMLGHALQTFEHADYLVYVGCYPNDPGTIAAARSIADPRIRIVVGTVPGPTTKADCLNQIWAAMREDEARTGARFKAVVLHDAEDVVHSAELRLFDCLIERFELVQLPVLPLIDPGSRWIAGHYADEFAEAHGKELVVREALGASVPSAGVGCAFSREALAAMAEEAGGGPFNAASLTEDYELGLRLHAVGGRAAFVRLPASVGRPVVMTREYFPSNIDAAVRQKARWMVGIALSGWDRLGWTGGMAERWMRMRDRQPLLAALLLLAAYAGLVLWAALQGLALATGLQPQPVDPGLAVLLKFNLALLLWRLLMRYSFVAEAYGWREGLRAIPRVAVSNVIAMLAARRAVFRYLEIRRTGRTGWDKTGHVFPAEVPAE